MQTALTQEAGEGNNDNAPEWDQNADRRETVEGSEDKAEPIPAELPKTMYTEAGLSEMDLEL
jgi:hypothetical protein